MSKKLKEALRKLCIDEDLRRRMAGASGVRILDWTPARTVAAFEEAISYVNEENLNRVNDKDGGQHASIREHSRSLGVH